MKSPRRKPYSLLFLALLALAVGLPAALTYRAFAQTCRNGALIVAIKANDTASSLALLRQGADPNATDSGIKEASFWGYLRERLQGYTPDPTLPPVPALFLAVERNNNEIAEALLRAGATNLEGEDAACIPPVLLAVKYRNPAMILTLLRYGAAQAQSLKRELLAEVVELGSIECARFLLDHGAAVNGSPVSVLAIAIEKKNRPLIDLLLQDGADVNGHNAANTSVVVLAVAKIELAWELLHRGAAASREDQNNLLVAAAANGYRDIVQYLLARGVKVNQEKHESPALLAAASGNQLEMVRLLLKHGAYPDTCIPGQGTPLMAAVSHNNRVMAQLLLSYEANIDCEDESGGPLARAAKDGNLSMVRWLVQRGAEVNEKDEEGAVLDHAVEHPSVLRFLLTHGAKVNGAPGVLKSAALLGAASIGNAQSVRLLLDYGANVNQASTNGRTPLMDAAMRGHNEVVKLLVRRRANVNACMLKEFSVSEYATARSLAEEEDRTEVVRFLKSVGAKKWPFRSKRARIER